MNQEEILKLLENLEKNTEKTLEILRDLKEAFASIDKTDTATHIQKKQKKLLLG